MFVINFISYISSKYHYTLPSNLDPFHHLLGSALGQDGADNKQSSSNNLQKLVFVDLIEKVPAQSLSHAYYHCIHSPTQTIPKIPQKTL